MKRLSCYIYEFLNDLLNDYDLDIESRVMIQEYCLRTYHEKYQSEEYPSDGMIIVNKMFEKLKRKFFKEFYEYIEEEETNVKNILYNASIENIQYMRHVNCDLQNNYIIRYLIMNGYHELITPAEECKKEWAYFLCKFAYNFVPYHVVDVRKTYVDKNHCMYGVDKNNKPIRCEHDYCLLNKKLEDEWDNHGRGEIMNDILSYEVDTFFDIGHMIRVFEKCGINTFDHIYHRIVGHF